MTATPPTCDGALQVRTIQKASHPFFSLGGLPQKTTQPFMKFAPFIVMVILLVFTASCKQDAKPGKYGYSFNIGSSSITLDAILPPKALSTLPSDYLQVNVDVGAFHFTTNDPAFMCFEGLVPFIFTEEIDYPGLFIAAYNDCRSGSVGHNNQLGTVLGAQRGLLDQGNLVALFDFPQSDLPGCTTVSSGAISCTLTTPTPTEQPTPTPAPGQSFSNIKLLINGNYYTEQQTFNQPLVFKVGNQISLQATWDGGALDGTGWYVLIVEQGKGALMRCDTGSTCETSDTFSSPIPGRIYDAELHDPSGNWTPSNVVYANWVS